MATKEEIQEIMGFKRDVARTDALYGTQIQRLNELLAEDIIERRREREKLAQNAEKKSAKDAENK